MQDMIRIGQEARLELSDLTYLNLPDNTYRLVDVLAPNKWCAAGLSDFDGAGSTLAIETEQGYIRLRHSLAGSHMTLQRTASGSGACYQCHPDIKCRHKINYRSNILQ